MSGKYVKHLLLFSLIQFFILSSFAQRENRKNDAEDLQLGVQAYQDGDFEKAVYYFERLFNHSSKNIYYSYLYNSYLKLETYKKAEKAVKRQIKRYNKRSEYLFDLGYVYQLSSDATSAKKQFEAAISGIVSQQDVISLANDFLGINELDYAQATYLKGRKKIKDYPFNFELADLYDQKQEYGLMIKEYINLLELNTGYLQSVQNALQTALSTDEKGEKKDLLRTELLRKIQRNASSTVYSEMLIWLYVQEKDFSGALVQAKALDKRNNESGSRIMALAKLCTANEQYDIAIESYEYVIEKGVENMRYQPAKMALVKVYNDKIVNSSYENEDLKSLETLYEATITELGENSNTVPLMKGLAHLKAFYLSKTAEAIALLDKVIVMPQVKAADLADCKIELADIYVVDDEIWEASLLYSQVEKAFKYDKIGEIAKFKNAKVFYYSGEFQWAKAQLDVLKGSTSKLIANDAMHLSLLITDNTTIDTLTTPLLKFAHAELLILQNRLEDALNVYDTIEYLFPGHSLTDEIFFKKYEIYFKKRKYSKAAKFLEQSLRL